MQIRVHGATCPRCERAVSLAAIERHPTRPDIALCNYQCIDCGPVLAKTLSLVPPTKSNVNDAA
jgi:hypothetical protein